MLTIIIPSELIALVFFSVAFVIAFGFLLFLTLGIIAIRVINFFKHLQSIKYH